MVKHEWKIDKRYRPVFRGGSSGSIEPPFSKFKSPFKDIEPLFQRSELVFHTKNEPLLDSVIVQCIIEFYIYIYFFIWVGKPCQQCLATIHSSSQEVGNEPSRSAQCNARLLARQSTAPTREYYTQYFSVLNADEQRPACTYKYMAAETRTNIDQLRHRVPCMGRSR